MCKLFYTNYRSLMMAMSLSELNNLPVEDCAFLLVNVVEHYPSAGKYLATKRPFQNLEELLNAASFFLENLSSIEQMTILQCHPDLVGKGMLTAESLSEQQCAGLHTIDRNKIEHIRQLNSSYRAKFGFPFVICARENKAAAIIEGLQRRMQNDKELEIKTGITEVKKICHLRIMDLVTRN